MKRTLYIIALILLLTIATLLGKVEFLAYNKDIMFFSWQEMLQALWQGLPLDMNVIGWVVMPVWVITLLSFKWPSMPLRWIVGPYLALVAFMMSCNTCTNIVMYENWKFLVDASIFSYMSSPGSASASVSVSYVITRLGSALLSSLLIAFLVVIITPKRIQIAQKQSRRTFVKEKKFPVPYTIVGLLLCLMIWGINGKRVNERSAFHSEKLLLNHAAINPVGHMVRSLIEYRKAFGEQFRLMPEEECNQIFSQIFPTDTEDITDTLLTTQRPDILTIQLESLGAPFIESLGGVKDVTPEICAWMKRGINFTNAWATSFRTDRGTVSAISGNVSYPTTSLMLNNSCLPSISSLGKVLRAQGYTADYMYGGNSNHMNKRNYLEAVGFKVWDIDDINVSKKERDAWGANDSITMNRMLAFMQKTKQENGPDTPFYWAWQTISSHEPWDVPYHRLDNKVYNAFAYTDHCVGQLLDSLSRTPLWDNLLVVLFTDHGHTYNLTLDNPEFFHIPLFFVGGAVKQIKNVDTIIAQNDIVATILSQMSIPHNQEFPWSRNVFSKNYTYPFAYCNYPAGALLVDNSGKTMMDTQSGYIMTEIPQTSSERLRNLKVMLQKSYDTIPQ